MSDPIITITDTETGGLNQDANPILSVATMVCSSAETGLVELANYYSKIRPPRGTTLEIPAVEDRWMDNYRAKILQWYDLYDGTIHDAKPAGFVVTAGAAMKNGFVQPDADGKFTSWNLDTARKWMDEAVELTDVDTDLATFVLQHFPTDRPINIAYNVPFDFKFVDKHLPKATQALGGTWVCAMKAFEKYVKAQDPKAKKGWKLGDAAKTAGVVNPAEHDALGDIRTTRPVALWLAQQGYL